MRSQCRAIFLSLAAFAWMAAAAYAADPPTFSGEVVRIFQAQCQTCHHPGDIGPFSLMDYQGAKPYAERIKERVTARTMPPWKPALGIGAFEDERILTGAQIDTIRQWVEAGAPEGDPAGLPPPLTFPDGWALGQPDLVLAMPEYSPPVGSDIYRCFSLPASVVEDKFVRIVDIRPGNRGIAHHVLLFHDPAGQSKALDDADSTPGYTCFGGPGFTPDGSFFGGWAPGMRPMVLGAGTGMKLAANARVVIQVHYHPETAGSDRTQVGLYFHSTPVDKLVRILPVVNPFFLIPPGSSNFEVLGFGGTPPSSRAHVVGIAPHMHLLGKDIYVEARAADGGAVPLIRIDDWDFEWQSYYRYRLPVPLPAASSIQFTAHYDNSASNPRNPNNPPQWVGWGEATTDEMALVFVAYTLDSEHQAPPQMSAAGLVNAATFQGGAVAPGEMVALFGTGLTSSWEAAPELPLPKTLSRGLKVSVNGVEAPLFYSSPAQVNFQAPFEISGTEATITLTRSEDGAQQTITVPLAEAHPGIFTLTGDPAGPAAAVHALSGAVVSASAPAARGGWVSLFVGGLGRVTPQVPSGSAPPGLSSTEKPVTVTVGGVAAEVQWAGLAPNFAGLYQVNFRVPESAPAGAAVPLSLAIDGRPSNTVTLAVQ